MAPIIHSTTFEKFSSLPKELQLMVWEAAIVPRILRITVESKKLPSLAPPTPSGRSRSTANSHVRFRSLEKCPVTLHVCRDSRTVALKHYIPSFHSSTYPQSLASSQKQTAIYFNPELDVVHLPDDSVRLSFFHRGDDETKRRIRVLAVKGSTIVQWEAEPTLPMNPPIWADVRRFKELEEIIWLTDEETMEKAGVIRDGIERHMKMFRDSLLAKGEVWRVPAVEVMDLRTFEREWP